MRSSNFHPSGPKSSRRRRERSFLGILLSALALGLFAASAAAQPAEPAAPAPAKAAAPKTPAKPATAGDKAAASKTAAEEAAAALPKSDSSEENLDKDDKPGRPERDVNTCATCHLSLPDRKLRAVAEQYLDSVHRDERIGCIACHKGVSTDPTVQAHDRSAGFIVRPSHEEIEAICGGCHEDPVFVRRFNARIPVDQRKLYELSRHGKLAMAGDKSSPTCTDCHGVHDIQHVASPNALPNRRRVVELCGKCHSDKERMKPYGLATDQVAKWKESVHGKAFENGSDVAPTCTGCHSPHAGTLPGTATTAALCDRCHSDERDYVQKSPHSRAFRRRGLGECVPCHGNHDVVHTSWLAGTNADSACMHCHSRSDKPKKVAAEVARLLAGVNDDEHSVEADLADAKETGLYVPDAQFALQRLRTARTRLVTRMHTLDLNLINEEVAQVKPIAAEAHDIVAKARRERTLERRGYYAALAVAALLFILLVAKAMQLAQRRGRSGA
jgi:predicted CXXCH cytochrome family protein